MSKYDYKYWVTELEYYNQNWNSILRDWQHLIKKTNNELKEKSILKSKPSGLKCRISDSGEIKYQLDHVSSSSNFCKIGNIIYFSTKCHVHHTDKILMTDHDKKIRVEINDGIHILMHQNLDDIQVNSKININDQHYFINYVKKDDEYMVFHNSYGPAQITRLGRQKPWHCHNWLDGYNVTDWLEQKGYTLPLSDKQKYEMELKFR